MTNLPHYGPIYPFIGIDANATVGEVVTSSIRPCGAAQQNYAAEHFHDFLLRRKMVLPSTFRHRGTQSTYLKDGGKRIDYIVVPQDMQPAVVNSYVIEDFIMQVDDHMPAAIDIHMKPAEPPEVICTRRVTKIDKEKIKDSVRKEAFIKDFISIQQQQVPWHTDVSTHCAIRQLQVRQCAQKHFPADRHKKQR